MAEGRLFMGYFSDLIEAGKCPACAGERQVTKFVPVEGLYPCSFCGGTGQYTDTWPGGAPEDETAELIDKLAAEVDAE
jgi:hypothetical protein